jgi:hypothetical protein
MFNQGLQQFFKLDHVNDSNSAERNDRQFIHSNDFANNFWIFFDANIDRNGSSYGRMDQLFKNRS